MKHVHVVEMLSSLGAYVTTKLLQLRALSINNQLLVAKIEKGFEHTAPSACPPIIKIPNKMNSETPTKSPLGKVLI